MKMQTRIRINYESNQDARVMQHVRVFTRVLKLIGVTCQGNDIVTNGGPAVNDSFHSPELSDKIIDFAKSMNKHDLRSAQDLITDGLVALGPACFWEEVDNDDEAKGAIKLLGWIQSYLER